jgi:hypothetical protein
LLWIAVTTGGWRALLGAREAAEFGTPATQVAGRFGAVRGEIIARPTGAAAHRVAVALPLPRIAMPSRHRRWRIRDRIVAASVRYRADAVLIGELRPGTFGKRSGLFVHGVGAGAAIAGMRDGIDIAAYRYARGSRHGRRRLAPAC